ncbi:MAG: O-antigen ligase family protein [Pyrinomonadaceae bacterium]
MMKPSHSTFERVIFGSYLLLVASLAIQKPSVTTFPGNKITATDLLFPLVAALTMLGILIGAIPLRRTRAFIFLGAYAAAFLAATFFSPQILQSLVKSLSTTYLVGLAVITFMLIRDERDLRRTIAVWLIGASIPVVVGLFTIALFYYDAANPLLIDLTYHFGAVPVGNFPRLSSTFVSASMFCSYLIVTMMFYFIFAANRRLPTTVWILGLASILTCIVFTVSIGIGAAVLAIAMWVNYRIANRTVGRVVLISGIVVCVCSLLLSFVALQPHSTAAYSLQLPFIGIEITPSSRLMVWTDAVNTFLNHFLIGNGPGMPSASVVFQNSEGGFSLLTDAHNSFLSVATQTGIIGLAAFVFLCCHLTATSFSKSHNTLMRFGLAIAFFAVFIVQGLTNSLEDPRHLWVLTGMILAADKIYGKENAGNLSADL